MLIKMREEITMATGNEKEKATKLGLGEVKETVKNAGATLAEKAEAVSSAAVSKVEKAVEETKQNVEEKAAEKKAVTGAKRGPKPGSTRKTTKEEVKPEVFIQYQSQEAVVADAIEKVKAEFVAGGHRASSIKSLQIYLKPEESAAYYVINQKVAGRVDLF